MKNFIVGIKLVPPNDQSSKSNVLTKGKTWTYSSASANRTLIQNDVQSFIVYVPDIGTCKDVPPKAMLTLAKKGVIHGVEYSGPETLTEEFLNQVGALWQFLDFKGASIYKLPTYLSGRLAENPRKFILGRICSYFITFSPDL